MSEIGQSYAIVLTNPKVLITIAGELAAGRFTDRDATAAFAENFGVRDPLDHRATHIVPA
jgi:hypothetical protein